jgi:hypothetical protein
MPSQAIYPFPQFHHLPASLPLDGAVRLELQNGLPVLRASTAVQRRITALLHKQQETTLSAEEIDELDRYEEIDDYLSFLNRIVRNLSQDQQL